MELLQNLLNFIFNTDQGKKLLPLITALLSGSVSLGDLLGKINLQALLPLINGFFNNAQNKNPTASAVGLGYGLKPVVNVADKDIVYTLNKYFCS